MPWIKVEALVFKIDEGMMRETYYEQEENVVSGDLVWRPQALRSEDIKDFYANGENRTVIKYADGSFTLARMPFQELFDMVSRLDYDLE